MKGDWTNTLSIKKPLYFFQRQSEVKQKHIAHREKSFFIHCLM